MNSLNDDLQRAIADLEHVWPLMSEVIGVRVVQLTQSLINAESEQIRGRILELQYLLGMLDRLKIEFEVSKTALSE